MLVELIILSIVGFVFIWLGYLIWKKEQINLIHSYHHNKVKDQDKKAYTQLMGKSVLSMGVGIILTGFINYIFQTTYGWMVFGISFGVAILIIHKAQMKYNGSWFS